MSEIEIIGIAASFLVVLSMCFKTTIYSRTLIMRAINAIGSTVFIVYGFLLPAYATAATNICAVVINVFYLIKEILDHKKAEKEKNNIV